MQQQNSGQQNQPPTPKARRATLCSIITRFPGLSTRQLVRILTVQCSANTVTNDLHKLSSRNQIMFEQFGKTRHWFSCNSKRISNKLNVILWRTPRFTDILRLLIQTPDQTPQTYAALSGVPQRRIIYLLRELDDHKAVISTTNTDGVRVWRAAFPPPLYY